RWFVQANRDAEGPSRPPPLLLELTLVVASPVLRRRPCWCVKPAGTDGFEALHVAEDIQALRDVLGAQANVFQWNTLQRPHVGDAGPVNDQRLQRHAFQWR